MEFRGQPCGVFLLMPLLWLLKIEFRSGLCGKSLYLLSHLDSLDSYFFIHILSSVLINIVATLVLFCFFFLSELICTKYRNCYDS